MNSARGGRLRPAGEGLAIASWNVEGLTEAKLIALQHTMLQRSIDIICMQETHRAKSDYYITDRGFLVILSGGATGSREYAGVGYVISPGIRRSVIGFTQASARMASLKLRVLGGKMAVFCAYAPHSGYPFDVRQQFFHEIGEFVQKVSTHGPKMVCGDWNARLCRRLPGEEVIFGPHLFVNDATIIKADANRHLLSELCASLDMVVANTFFDVPLEERVTCYNIGHEPIGPVCWESHSQIDFMLIPRHWLHSIRNIFSDRLVALASHHFILTARIDVCVPKIEHIGCTRPLASALQDITVANMFAAFFEANMEREQAESENPEAESVNLLHARMVDAFHGAAAAVLPHASVQQRRPWISASTLDLLQRRNAARSNGTYDEERRIGKLIKSSVARDRRSWLDALLKSGDWGCIRKLRKGFCPQQGRLRDATGQLVSSEMRADTLASHLERVQWAVRHTTAVPPRDLICDELPIDIGVISSGEVAKAAKQLKSNRASGLDGVPSEFWKAIVLNGSPEAQWALEFCQACWRDKVVPEAWHIARVAMIFKKGDPSLCDNSCPISLLPIGYKLFATILLGRLRAGGAENRLWPTQFGFRRKRGTGDALFIARRTIEDAWATKNGKVVLLALDWAKAFDSVSPTSLAMALHRFGCPPAFVDMIAAIYCDRKFVVKDGSCTSEPHSQHYGICQGCPLSPFLFIIVMSVLMHDAKAKLEADVGMKLASELFVHELVYADDTLVIDVRSETVQAFMECIGSAGAEYGLVFNWSKLEALPVRTTAEIRKPDGTLVTSKDSMMYLGSLLAADGRVGSELGRRLGLAQRDFRSLRQLWSHASLSRARKLQIFNACVVSTLTYGLHTSHFNQAERRRLDGFQARCLRVILKVPAAYFSRVPNRTVLAMARSRPLSENLLKQQMKYMGQVARRSDTDPVRQMIFQPGGISLRIPNGVRRVGRPRVTWAPTVFGASLVAAGSLEKLTGYFRNSPHAERDWHSVVNAFNCT